MSSIINKIASVLPSAAATEVALPEQVDAVIIGAGPAGCMGSLCLNTYGLNVLHVDERSEPTTAGRADGLQPRTIEVLRNIGGAKPHTAKADIESNRAPFHGGGIAKRMIADGVRVYEVAFWDPTETQQLARTSRAASCPENAVDVVDNYTLLLHQGLIEQAYLSEIQNRRDILQAQNKSISSAPEGGVFRNTSFVSCRTLSPNEDALAATHPVETVLSNSVTKTQHTVRSKYLIGNDGARSQVRKCISGGGEGDGEWKGAIRMEGEATDIVWGVMDANVTTDFPDIKFKCLIHSKDSGSIMIIPRESNLVRFYVQLQQEGNDPVGGKSVHIERSKATQDVCIARAKKIFEPFKVEFGYIDWFSVYQIGQRVASAYTLDHRVFLAGDATHTHSPKAGQGMNISMLDMHNLCWKINLVEKGLGDASILLPTYQLERRDIAQQLIAFDAEYSRIFSGRSPDATQLTDDPLLAGKKKGNAVDAQKFIEVFKKNARFTSGVGAVYKKQSPLNGIEQSTAVKGLKLTVGERLTPGKLTRAMDANVVRLQQEVRMNGAFRIHVFAGDLAKTSGALEAFGKYLDSPTSFMNKYRPATGVSSSIVDGFYVA